MKTIEILGDNREPTFSHTDEGCRGILVRDDKILLIYYKSKDLYLIPGGGLEAHESLEECCERELAEETGIRVNAHTHYLTLEEYYHEYYFKSHYFLCKFVGQCEQTLTENEKKNGLEPRWVDFDEALKIFENYESYKETDEASYGAYFREYTALKEVQCYL